MGKLANKFLMILDLEKVLGQAALLDAPGAALSVLEAAGSGGDAREAIPQ